VKTSLTGVPVFAEGDEGGTAVGATADSQPVTMTINTANSIAGIVIDNFLMATSIAFVLF